VECSVSRQRTQSARRRQSRIHPAAFALVLTHPTPFQIAQNHLVSSEPAQTHLESSEHAQYPLATSEHAQYPLLSSEHAQYPLASSEHAQTHFDASGKIHLVGKHAPRFWSLFLWLLCNTNLKENHCIAIFLKKLMNLKKWLELFKRHFTHGNELTVIKTKQLKHMVGSGDASDL
jgi:hypothetical protein